MIGSKTSGNRVTIPKTAHKIVITDQTVHQGGHVQVQIKFPVFTTNFPVFFNT